MDLKNRTCKVCNKTDTLDKFKGYLKNNVQQYRHVCTDCYRSHRKKGYNTAYKEKTAKKVKKVKKRKVKKVYNKIDTKSSPWYQHLQTVKLANPGKSYQEVRKIASASYKNEPQKGGDKEEDNSSGFSTNSELPEVKDIEIKRTPIKLSDVENQEHNDLINKIDEIFKDISTSTVLQETVYDIDEKDDVTDYDIAPKTNATKNLVNEIENLISLMHGGNNQNNLESRKVVITGDVDSSLLQRLGNLLGQ